MKKGKKEKRDYTVTEIEKRKKEKRDYTVTEIEKEKKGEERLYNN